MKQPLTIAQTESGSRSPFLWILPAILAVLLAYHFGVCTQDDAFISFRYAENWAQGLGWVFNEGEYVEGISNPLWTFFFGLLFVLQADPVISSLWLGYASIIFLLYTCHRLFLFFRLPLPLHLFGLVMIALDPSMTLEAVQGLESVFYAGLLTLFVTLSMEERFANKPHRRSIGLSIALCLTRPEAPLIVGMTYSGLWLWDKDWKSSMAPLLWVGLFLSGITGLRMLYFGDPLPNTFYAKVGGFAVNRGLEYCWAHCKYHPIMWLGLLSIFYRSTAKTRLLHWVLLPYLAYIICIGGDFKPTSRFLLAMDGFFTVLSLHFFYELQQHFFQKKVSSYAGLGLLISISLYTQGNLLKHAEHWAQERRDNLIARKVVGDWLEAHTPSDTVIAMHSIGVIPFYAQRRTIDMWGLTDRTIAKTPNETFGKGMAGHEKSNPAYVFSRNPDIYLPEDGFFQPSYKMQTPEANFPEDFTEKYKAISIPIEGSWLNIWVHQDFAKKGGFGEWKKVP